MALDITVNLTTELPGGTADFGIPLIVASGQSTYTNGYVKCKRLSDVVDHLGNAFGSETKLYKAAKLLLSQKNAPREFAILATTSTIANAYSQFKNEDWRQLIVAETTEDESIPDIAAWVEGLDYKMFFTSLTIANDVDDFKTAYTAALETFKDANNGSFPTKTVVMYYDESVDSPEAALVGATAGKMAGSFTYKNIILKGIPALTLTDSQIDIINGTDETGHGMTVVTKAGDIVTTEGKTISGEYIDVIDSRDWIIENIEYDCQKVFNKNDKVPYTAPGIALLESAVTAVLQTAFTNGMIAPQEDNDTVGDFSTQFEPKSNMTEDDIVNRRYTGGYFTFVLAGAIHEATINGTITM